MTVSVCGACGAVISKPGGGRPRKLCDACRTNRYGGVHRAKRAALLKDYVGKPCSRCGRPLLEGDDIHLDHADGGGPDDYRGLSHARCNLAAAGRQRAVNAAHRRAAEAQERRIRPRDPGPPRAGIVHAESCRCRETARYMGVWPSQCWDNRAPWLS